MELTLDTAFTGTFPFDRVKDTFTRADANTAGVTELAGIPWDVDATAEPNLWRAGIRSNQLSVYRDTGVVGDPQNGFATVNTGKSDGTVSGRIVAAPDGIAAQRAFFVFRYVNPNNYLTLLVPTGDTKWALYKRVNGTGTRIADGEVVAQQGQTLRVTMNGTGVVVYADEVVAVRRVDVPEFANATRHGFGVRASTGGTLQASRFDDFDHIGG